jgi:hypothetical protein
MVRKTTVERRSSAARTRGCGAEPQVGEQQEMKRKLMVRSIGSKEVEARWSMETRAEEEGGAVNSFARHR